MVTYEKRMVRWGKDYEVQNYDKDGNNSTVFAFKTAEDLAYYLAAKFWGCVKFHDYNNPTVYYNGERFGDFNEIAPEE